MSTQDSDNKSKQKEMVLLYFEKVESNGRSMQTLHRKIPVKPRQGNTPTARQILDVFWTQRQDWKLTRYEFKNYDDGQQTDAVSNSTRTTPDSRRQD